MDSEIILNYKINTELINIIDFFGDIINDLKKKFLKTFENYNEFNEITVLFKNIDDKFVDFALYTHKSMNIFITNEEFNNLLNELLIILQEICVNYRKIITFLYKSIIDFKFHHYSTNAIIIYINFIKHWGFNIKKLNDFIHSFTNNKVIVYKEKELNNYYKIIYLLNNILIKLYINIDLLYINMNLEFTNINFKEIITIYNSILYLNDEMISLIILLILNFKFHINDDLKISIKKDILNENIYLILKENNYIL